MPFFAATSCISCKEEEAAENNACIQIASLDRALYQLSCASEDQEGGAYVGFRNSTISNIGGTIPWVG